MMDLGRVGHSLFLQATEKCVARTSDYWKSELKNSRDPHVLQELFYRSLDCFAEERAAIAHIAQVVDKERFGSRRDRRECFQHIALISEFYDRKSSDTKALIERIQLYLKEMQPSLKAFGEKHKVFEEAETEGRKSSVEVFIYSVEDLVVSNPDWVTGNTLSYTTYRRICDICGIKNPLDENALTLEETKKLVANYDLMQRLKEKAPKEYQQLKINFYALHMRNDFPDEKMSDFIRVIQRHEISGKMYALSEYWTWTYRTLATDPIARMSEYSAIVLAHQDPFLIPETLKDISRLFAETLLLETPSLPNLHRKVGLITLELSHATPYKRGSAAIAEWMEQSIYRFFGYNVYYTHSVNIASLTLSSAIFMQRYPKMITVESNSNSSDTPSK